MIIIAGWADMDPSQREAALTGAKPLIDGALTQAGCLNYEWTMDPHNAARVWVFERWSDEASLAHHFDNHWYADMRAHMGAHGLVGADVLKHRVDLSEPVYNDEGIAKANFFTEGK